MSIKVERKRLLEGITWCPRGAETITRQNRILKIYRKVKKMSTGMVLALFAALIAAGMMFDKSARQGK